MNNLLRKRIRIRPQYSQPVSFGDITGTINKKANERQDNDEEENDDDEDDEDDRQSSVNIRTEFPETWMWFERNIGLD